MKNKLEWQEENYGASCFVRINRIDYMFDVFDTRDVAVCREFLSGRRVAVVSSNKGTGHLKDAIIEKTIAVLQADVDKLREITGMEVPK